MRYTCDCPDCKDAETPCEMDCQECEGCKEAEQERQEAEYGAKCALGYV